MISPFITSLELQAHFSANQSQRGLDLIRTQWNYMLTAPWSVGSSLVEGYWHDGSLFYPFGGYTSSYISHAHPWASSPTIAATFYILGLQVQSADHKKWSFTPTVDVDLDFAMGGITTARGFISAGWKTEGAGMRLAVKSPAGTTGVVGVPVKGTGWRIENGGEVVCEYGKSCEGRREEGLVKIVVGEGEWEFVVYA
ncbi:hypothetical protein RUND412_011024 [Rhizina undulata]